MDRRVAPLAALPVLLAFGGVALGAAEPAAQPMAAVSWPPSTLLVSELQTGGASASDEFAEITNAGAGAVDLIGLELVYVTSSGGTVTRKASWSSSLLLEPGRHLLVANSSGIFAGLADATYSGGFAATGGAMVLRAIGGAPVDAVGWGDATNGFVEGSPAAAPAAGASIERRPGGLDGNTIDSNSNAADWFGQADPNPQSLAAPPVPAPAASPTVPPGASPATSVGPSAEPTELPTAEPSAPPSASPVPSTSPAPTVAPTAEPTAVPTPTPLATPTATPAPSPTAMPEPSATPSPTADPTSPPTPAPTATPQPIVSVLSARGLPNGAVARVMGVLTTHLGALESGRKAFVQDDTGGIALYLDVEVVGGLPADTLVIAEGTVDERFGERTLRVAVADLVTLGEQQRPAPWELPTGEIGEPSEGWRAIVQGVTVGSPTELADGLGLMVDDGSGAVRVIVGPDALAGASVPSGTQVVAAGPVGQRDSSGTGLAGYRLHATEQSDFGIILPPTPTPAPTPTPSPTSAPTPLPTATPAPTASPSVTPSPSATPVTTPAPTATPSPTVPPTITVVEARGAPIGTVVSVSGVVTAEAGRLGMPPLIAIADGTGGIAVRLPDGVIAPARGTTVVVRGALADPYGQLELRPAASGWRVTGSGSLPAAVRIAAADLGEATEGRLAELTGTVDAAPTKSTSGDLTITLTDAAGTSFRVIADGSSGIAASELVKGRTYRLTGIVGQRASRKGALDGYRLYLRDRADIVVAATPAAGPGASGAIGVTASVATALAAPDGTTLAIEGIVTAGTSLLDSSGRRIVVQDATGAIEVLLPSGASGPGVGTKLRVTGETGRAWGAPRLRATTVAAIGAGSVVPLALTRSPAERDEWLLVRLSGTVEKVERLGDRWRAEVILVDGSKAAIHGQAGAEIPSTAILAGRRITVVGIVKRPYPTASDRRFAVLPRGGADVAIGPAGGGTGAGETLAATARPDAGGAGGPDGGAVDVTPDTDLAMLGERVGERVQVGGLIARLGADGFDLDDGTAIARVELRGEQSALLPLLRDGEAVAATGVVELRAGAPIVVVDDDGRLLRVGSLGQALPIGGLAEPAASSPSPAGQPSTLAADSALLAPGLAPTSVLALALVSLLSVAMTLVRRRLARQRIRAAVVARLATLRPELGAPAARDDNHGPS